MAEENRADKVKCLDTEQETAYFIFIDILITGWGIALQSIQSSQKEVAMKKTIALFCIVLITLFAAGIIYAAESYAVDPPGELTLDNPAVAVGGGLTKGKTIELWVMGITDATDLTLEPDFPNPLDVATEDYLTIETSGIYEVTFEMSMTVGYEIRIIEPSSDTKVETQFDENADSHDPRPTLPVKCQPTIRATREH